MLGAGDDHTMAYSCFQTILILRFSIQVLLSHLTTHQSQLKMPNILLSKLNCLFDFYHDHHCTLWSLQSRTDERPSFVDRRNLTTSRPHHKKNLYGNWPCCIGQTDRCPSLGSSFRIWNMRVCWKKYVPIQVVRSVARMTARSILKQSTVTKLRSAVTKIVFEKTTTIHHTQTA